MRILLLTLTLALAAPTVAAATTAPLLPPRVVQAIDARIGAGQYPAMVVAVVDGDHSHVYGFGLLADGKAPDADTVFQIGSVTKTFTAALLAEATAHGAARLDTPVAQWLPCFRIPVRHGKAITLGELAMQDSGLPRIPDNLQPANVQDPYADYDSAKLKTFLAGYKLSRDPGASYAYSNVGVGLLGRALASHAGMSYAQLLEANIFKPLGMTSSTTTFVLPLAAGWAAGHGADGNPTQPWHFGALPGAGAINSTGADMLRYLEANLGHGPGTLVAAMRTAQQPRRGIGQDERIGLIWMTRHTPGGDVIWHNGKTGGYASFMGFTPDHQRGVVILTNIARPVDDLGFAALLPKAPAPLAPTPATLQTYVGRYRLAPGAVLDVTLQGSQLMAQLTGQSPFPIYAGVNDQFYYTVVDAGLSFKRDNAGKIVSLVLHQNGTNRTAPRIP